MGGDEFLLIFPNFTEKKALEILQEVEDSISEFNLKKNKRYRISFSYGFAEYYWNDDMSIDELIGIADLKMYKIKNIKKHSNKDFQGK
jgi:diguanylate cyclase (GGDEF)-like protein